ncbi:MAG: hypothetical protein JHC40_02675 [Burkholderiales bacterium]|nr:hypothetical protein [Burkholderiales bacterium]
MAAIAALLSALALATYAWQARRQLEWSIAQSGQLKERLRLAEAADAPRATPTPADYVAALATAPAVETVLRRLQRACAAQRVVLVSVNANSRDASPQSLGRTEVLFVLRGAYPQLKSVLAEGVDQPGAVLQRLMLRRQASSSDVEAQVALVLLTQPTTVRRN